MPPPPPPSGLPPGGGIPPAPMGGGYSGYAVAQPRTPGLAIAALVLGIIAAVSLVLGFFCYGLVSIVCGAIALFLGLRARGQIKASGGALGGYGMAQAGWIIGLVSLILGVLELVFLGILVAMLAINGVHITPTP